jgi:hypothetical protein
MLPLRIQRKLLAPLRQLRDSGEVSAVRLSTRPDAIDRSVIELLLEYKVSLVELGVQSMDDEVLVASGRGHTSADTVRAFALLQEAGIAIGVHLMPGLPGDSPSGSLRSLRKVLELKPATLRIYPAVVLEGTDLAARFRRGEYQPSSLADTVVLGARMLHAAHRAGVPVIRMGIQATDALSGPDGVVAGPYHPSLRSLVEAEMTCDLLLHLAGDLSCPLTVTAHPSRQSAVSGPGGVNRDRLRGRGLLLQRVLADDTLMPYDLVVASTGVVRKGNILNDLTYSGVEEYHA